MLQGAASFQQVATPTHLINTEIYGDLVRAGFRRSGVFTYRPHCDTCRSCVPVRVPVAEFCANRSQHPGIDRTVDPLRHLRHDPGQFGEGLLKPAIRQVRVAGQGFKPSQCKGPATCAGKGEKV
jgi:arginyl-tRNA--protein-N-Asp/Glu arginylyltransferase